MAEWSLMAEFIALIVVAIMAFSVHTDRTGRLPHSRARLFAASLHLLGTSIVLNGITTCLLSSSLRVPWLLNMLLNTAYFLVSATTASAIVLYLFSLLFEHVYDERPYRRATAAVLALVAAFAVLLLANFPTGIVFSIDGAGDYHRGPLVQAGYLVLAVEFAMLVLAYARHRASADRRLARTMRILPLVVAALTAFQLLYPQVLLNGTIGAAALLILLLNFQSRRLDIDSLTHLGNQQRFYSELSLREASGQAFQVVTVAVHGLSSVNRRFGHRGGDELLYQVGLWLDGLDEKGTAFRSGKVTFAVVRPYSGADGAELAIRRVADRFEEPWPMGRRAYRLQARCCSLVHDGQQWDPDRIVSYLDAMNRYAKSEKLAIVRFDREFARRFERRQYLTEVLADAIKNRRFTAHYQPIISCSSMTFSHAEALVRLEDRKGRAVPPGEFIPLAEELGRVDEVSWIMLDSVCRFLGSNPGLPLASVTVNMSMPQMLDPQLKERLTGCLERHGVAPCRLKIEVTERILADDSGTVARTLGELRDAGIGCYLDDFGTGYSNLSLVLGLPLERVKIDRSLLVDVTEDARHAEVVRRLVELFHALGIGVVAEGIETDEQVAAVTDMGVDAIQGFRFARPMPPDQLLPFLETSTYR